MIVAGVRSCAGLPDRVSEERRQVIRALNDPARRPIALYLRPSSAVVPRMRPTHKAREDIAGCLDTGRLDGGGFTSA